MAKVTLGNSSTGLNSSAQININNVAVEQAMENTLSRDGTAPNSMLAPLDLGGNPLTNVADGANPQDAATVAQIGNTPVLAAQAAASASNAAASEAASLSSANAALLSETNAAANATSVNREVANGVAGLDANAELVRLPAGAAAEVAAGNAGNVKRADGTWGTAGGATGAAGDQVFYENGQVVSASYTLTTGTNAMSTGPITVNAGVVVTVPTGAKWVVI